MKMIKRELFLCITLTAFVFVCALAWGRPFLSVGSSSAAVHLQQVQSSRFTGTVMHNGAQFLLRDSSGQVFRLNGSQSAQSFDGKNVNITGTLDKSSNTLSVDRIEQATR